MKCAASVGGCWPPNSGLILSCCLWPNGVRQRDSTMLPKPPLVMLTGWSKELLFLKFTSSIVSTSHTICLLVRRVVWWYSSDCWGPGTRCPFCWSAVLLICQPPEGVAHYLAVWESTRAAIVAVDLENVEPLLDKRGCDWKSLMSTKCWHKIYTHHTVEFRAQQKRNMLCVTDMLYGTCAYTSPCSRHSCWGRTHRESCWNTWWNIMLIYSRM